MSDLGIIFPRLVKASARAGAQNIRMARSPGPESRPQPAGSADAESFLSGWTSRSLISKRAYQISLSGICGTHKSSALLRARCALNQAVPGKNVLWTRKSMKA